MLTHAVHQGGALFNNVDTTFKDGFMVIEFTVNPQVYSIFMKLSVDDILSNKFGIAFTTVVPSKHEINLMISLQGLPLKWKSVERPEVAQAALDVLRKKVEKRR